MLLKNKKRDLNQSIKQERLAGRLAGRLIKWQTALADYLNKKAARLSDRQLKIGLVIFCLSFGGTSLYVIVKALRSDQSQTSSFVMKQGRLPQSIGKSATGQMPEGNAITPEEYNKIQAFKKYMDSLGRNPETEHLRDSILHKRPQLMDSISMIEQLYLEQ